MNALYIDPGTGSMLFSIFIGLAAASYFLFRTLLIRVKFIFTGRKARNAKKYQIVIYSEGRHYWNVFSPVLEALERRAQPAHYLTSAADDPFFEKRYECITGEYIGEGNKAFTRLNFLDADICLMTTPGLEVYQLKRSKSVRHYAHILHDTGDVTCYRLFGIDWFDSILLSGEYQKADIRSLEEIRGTRVKQLPVTGSTYLDVYNEKIKTLPREDNHQCTVLISPSWGPGTLLNRFGEKLIDPLITAGRSIIIRPHPQSLKHEKQILNRLHEKYKNVSAVSWDYSPENLTALSQSDIMISDFSGIIFDYVFLFNRPVLYHNTGFNMEMYDAGDLDHKPWKFGAVERFGAALDEDMLDHIGEVITSCLNSKLLNADRAQAKNTAWQYIGESGERAADFLISTLKGFADA